MRKDTAALVDCMTLINGRAYKRTELLSEGTPVLRIQNLNGGNNWYYSNLSLPENKYCEKDDLLYAWSATFGPYRYTGPKAIYHYHIWKVLPHEKVMDKNFAFYALQNITQKVKDKAHGISMLHITKTGMEAMPVYLPPLAEQKKIAAILDEADQLRRLNQSLIEKYDALSQSLFLDMFGDPVTNPKGWEKSRLIETCSKISVGFVGTCEPFYTDKNKGIPMLRTGNLGEGFLKFKNLKYVTREFHDKQKKSQLFSGDILIARHGDNGKAVLYNGEFEHSNCLNIVILRPKADTLKSIFVQYLLNHENTRKMMGGRTGGATQKVINTKAIQKLELPVPPLSLQTKFAERQKKIEAQKAQAQSSLEQSEALFNSLLQRAFKGELV